jgi:carbon storage regulator
MLRCNASDQIRRATAGQLGASGRIDFLAAQHRRGTTMLVLSRKVNETIIINDNIVITVVDIRGDKVRLGIEAPKDVPVHRQEVYDAIKRAEGTDGVRRADSSNSSNS